jgi:hypothetical protein
MRTGPLCTLLFAPFLSIACLSVGDSQSDHSPTDASAGGSGAAVGDGAWPDGAGGTGAADASAGAAGSESGGSGGSGATGGTGGSGGIGATGGMGGSGGIGATGGTGGSGGIGATGGTGGSGGTGGAPTWNAYAYNLNTGAWSTPVPLNVVWSGQNAPPTTGIWAAAQLEHFDRLLVFASDGKYYLRKSGVWQTPVAIATAFPALAGMTLRALYHVASPPGTTPLTEDLTFVDNPKAVLYRYNSNDSTVWEDSVTMTDDPTPAAPQGTGTALWSFEVRDTAKYGTADYYRFYWGYSNGNFYQFDAAFVWKSWTIGQSPFWSGKANAPPTSGLQAAWTDAALNRFIVVGP